MGISILLQSDRTFPTHGSVIVSLGRSSVSERCREPLLRVLNPHTDFGNKSDSRGLHETPLIRLCFDRLQPTPAWGRSISGSL